MSSSRVSALTLVLLIAAGCEAEVTSSPDYDDYDGNATLRYIFFSNTSVEDLDTFLKDRKHLLDSHEDPDEEQDWDEDQVGVTTAGQREGGGVTLDNAASSAFTCQGLMMMMMMMVVVMETHS